MFACCVISTREANKLDLCCHVHAVAGGGRHKPFHASLLFFFFSIFFSFFFFKAIQCPFTIEQHLMVNCLQSSWGFYLATALHSAQPSCPTVALLWWCLWTTSKHLSPANTNRIDGNRGHAANRYVALPVRKEKIYYMGLTIISLFFFRQIITFPFFLFSFFYGVWDPDFISSVSLKARWSSTQFHFRFLWSHQICWVLQSVSTGEMKWTL